MRWFRDHIRRSSWLALLALAINFGLSFGHVHAVDNRFATGIAALASPDNEQSPAHHDGDQADLLCPICMAASAIGHALACAPPALPLALAETPIDLTTESVFVLPQPPRAAFRSRGPPIS